MSSDPIRGTTEIPQAVRQSTRMPPTLPWLTDSAVTGSLASRKAALQQFNESMDTWWRRTRAAVQSDYEELAAGASSAITTSTDTASALRNEVQERVSQNETIVAQIQALVLNSGNSRVFIQTEEPGSPALYDTWFDTDDNFHEYVYDGTAWVDVRDGAISGAIAAVGTEQTARMSADSVLSGRIDTVVTRMTNAETGITGLNTALDAVSTAVTAQGNSITAQGTAISSLQSSVTSQGGTISGHTTSISSLQTTVTSQGNSITAQGTRITSLESSVNTATTGLLARVATIEGAYVTDTEVSAAIASEVSARNGAITAAVSAETSARVAADGAIHARWGVAIDVNGAVVGRVQLDGTNQTSAFTVDASKFTVWNGTSAVPPFQVIGGQVRVANLSLVSADIGDRSLANIDSAAATKLGGIAAGADVTLNAINGGLTINSGGVTLAGTGAIKSSNFSAGSSGWGINANGDAEFNSIILRNPLMYYPLAAPTLSKSQLFANSLAVSASAGAGQTIRYTSDGSSVTASSTEWPQAGLTIADTTTIRVRAFNGSLQSDEVVATYTKNTLIRPNLTNDTNVCPAASDGSNPVLTNAVTTMEVYLGTVDDSANWAYSATPSAGVTGTLSGRTWTTTGLTVDQGYVLITATKTGVGSVVARFNLTKTRAGANGENGADGPAVFTLVNDANCAVGPNWVQRTVGNGAWDAAAHTLESYVNGAYCSFRVNSAAANVHAGLNSDPLTNNSYDSLDFAWNADWNGYSVIFESGTQVSVHGTYTPATVFAVNYDGKQVTYLKDGAVCRTVAAAANLRLSFDCSIAGLNSKATNIAFGPQGAAGADGANGADATAYWLVTSSPTIKLSGSTFSPATLTFTGKAQVGAGAPGDYACRFWIAESTDGTNFTTKYTSASDEAAKAWTPTGTTVKAVRCRMYQAGGAAVVLDEEIVNVIGEAPPVFSGGSTGGGGTIVGSWTVPTGLSLTLTVPAGARLIQFSGVVVNYLSGSQTVQVEIRVGASTVQFGSYSFTYAGQSADVALSKVENIAAGTVTIAVGAFTGVGQALLHGEFIVL